MNIITLIVIVIALVLQNITKKEYNKKTSHGGFTFTFASAVCAALVFMLNLNGQFYFTKEVLWYSAAFAAAYSAATVGALFAIKTGPLSLSALGASYSLVIPTTYGLMVLGESITVFLISGIILLLVSIMFLSSQKSQDEKKITTKWLFYVVLSFLGNGFCSVFQRMQQINLNGLYKNEFMIIALLISSAVMFTIAIFVERKDIVNAIRVGFSTYSLGGLCNGLVNFLVMTLTFKMPASLMFPIISCGSILLTTLVSVLVYRERLSTGRKVGVALGVGAIILLNI